MALGMSVNAALGLVYRSGYCVKARTLARPPPLSCSVDAPPPAWSSFKERYLLLTPDSLLWYADEEDAREGREARGVLGLSDGRLKLVMEAGPGASRWACPKAKHFVELYAEGRALLLGFADGDDAAAWRRAIAQVGKHGESAERFGPAATGELAVLPLRSGAVAREGRLLKLGSKYVPSMLAQWFTTERWAVLRDQTLGFFDGPDTATGHGEILLDGAALEDPEPLKLRNGSGVFAFRVHTRDGASVQLAAHSFADAGAWAAALRRAAAAGAQEAEAARLDTTYRQSVSDAASHAHASPL